MIDLLNVCGDVNSWVRETHEIHEQLTLMNNCESTVVKKEKAFRDLTILELIFALHWGYCVSFKNAIF